MLGDVLHRGLGGGHMMFNGTVLNGCGRQLELLLFDPVAVHARSSLRPNPCSQIIIFPTDPTDQARTPRIPRSQRLVVEVGYSLIEIFL